MSSSSSMHFGPEWMRKASSSSAASSPVAATAAGAGSNTSNPKSGALNGATSSAGNSRSNSVTRSAGGGPAGAWAAGSISIANPSGPGVKPAFPSPGIPSPAGAFSFAAAASGASASGGATGSGSSQSAGAGGSGGVPGAALRGGGSSESSDAKGLASLSLYGLDHSSASKTGKRSDSGEGPEAEESGVKRKISIGLKSPTFRDSNGSSGSGSGGGLASSTGTFFRSSTNEPARGLNARGSSGGSGSGSGSGLFQRIGSGGNGPLAGAAGEKARGFQGGVLGAPIGRAAAHKEEVPRSPNPEEPGTPTFGSAGFGNWTRPNSQRNHSGGNHVASGGGANATAGSTSDHSAAAVPPSRGEAERISGSSYAARFKRERAPGEGPIGPPPDHSGGFGRGRKTERAALYLNRPTGAEKASGVASGTAPASSPSRTLRDDAPPSSAAAAAAGGTAHYTEEDFEDEAKILDALRLEEEERQAAREVDGWSPQQSFWFYKDNEGKVQGPFVATNMQTWHSASYFKHDLLVRREEESEFRPLGDVIQETGSETEPFLVPPPRQPLAAPEPEQPADNLANGQAQASVASPWGVPQQSANLPGGFQNPLTPMSGSAFQDAGQQAFGSSPFFQPPQQAQQQANFGMPGEMSLEDKLRAQEQYLFMLQRQQLIEQSLRSGAQPDPNMLAAAFGMPNFASAQPPWANQHAAPDAWNQPSMQFPFIHQQQQIPLQQQLHKPTWDSTPQAPADPWGGVPRQSAIDRQNSSVTEEMRSVPEAIGTPRRARSPAPAEMQPAASSIATAAEPAAEDAPFGEEAKVETEEYGGAEVQQPAPQSEDSLSSLAEDEFLKHDAAGFKLDEMPAMSEAAEDPVGSGPATPAVPAKPAPWASAIEEQQKQKQGSSGGASLREIQEAERKAAEAKKNAARAAAAAARASKAAGASGGSAQPVTMSWGLASVPSSAGKAIGGVVSSPVSSTPSQPAWNTTAVTQQKKTLAEIQEEEQKRARRAKELAQAARATTGGKGYAESAAATAAAQSPQSPAPGWNLVGSSGKPGPATPTRPFAAIGNAPQRSVSASATVPTTRTVSAASSLVSRPNGSLPRPVTAGSSSGPSLEFIAYLKQQLKGLNVKVDDFVEMLMSFPLDPSPDVVEIIAESIYANSSTMDGRRFAEDFVAKRKMDAQGRALPTTSIAASVGPSRSASDVLKTQPPKAEDKFSGFKVVKAKGGKKKGTK